MPAFRAEYDVDILVRGWDNVHLTAQCIRSVLERTGTAPSCHVTYVDNGSNWPEVLYYMGDLIEKGKMSVIRLPTNHGSVRAINVGLAQALFTDSRFIMLMDNDTTVPECDPDWLKRLVGYFEQEKVGAAGCVSNYVSGYQHVCAVPFRFLKDPPIAAPVLVSFAMMLRKEAVEQVGFFDERFEPGNAEDYDYCLQLRQAGWLTVIAESVYINHVGSQTFRQMKFQELLQTNMAKLQEKWGGKEGLARMGVEFQ